MEMKRYDLIVMGGGPGGSSAAITAARLGARVLLLERGHFPRHKVCGEFVSGEALTLLSNLLMPEQQVLLSNAPRTSETRLFVERRVTRFPIPPAASISRYELDHALWTTAEGGGVVCQQDVSVEQLVRTGELFIVSTSSGKFAGRTVIDATGRWSKLRGSGRPRLEGDRSEAWSSRSGGPTWLGVKAHFAEKENPQGGGQEGRTTDLYFFEGGYCGVQPMGPMGNDEINVCAMVRADIATRLEDVLLQHEALRERSARWKRLTEVVSTAPLIFRAPQPEDNGVLRAGDAAAFIDPFVGDGISLALRSGELGSVMLSNVWRGKTRVETVARHYRHEYRKRFEPALRTAGRLRKILNGSTLVRRMAVGAMRFPSVAEYVVGHTR